MEMRNQFLGTFLGTLVTLAAVLIFSLAAVPQTAKPQQSNAGHSPWKFYPKDRAVGDGGPAPKRDLSGTWAGPGSGSGIKRVSDTENPVAPPLTPLGQQLYAMNKPIGKWSPAGTNDPHTRYCDPFGVPQNMLNEMRGMSISTMPNRIILLIEYQDLWREIWTDGRALPTNVGGTGENALDPRYNGYSVGHWEDDYTLVVDTTGLDDRTWATKNGYPHSIDAHVQERFTRMTHNDLKLTVTLDDPKIYTKTFNLGTEYFRWVPNQELDEWLCVPSEVMEYLQRMGDPAGSDPNAAPQRR